MRPRSAILWVFILAALAFLGWRLIRPMNIFIVSDAFEHPVSTAGAPEVLGSLRAEECAVCHREFYEEWRTSIHSRAWTDPYFQTDWRFDDSQQICRNCHTPLDRQQEHRVVGFRDEDKWDPVLVPNPDFDPTLQHEGVTCAACHLRQGMIVSVYGDTGAPHPVKRLTDPNQVCVRCHVVEGERWDTFFRFPPCGTVAEILETPGALLDRDGTGRREPATEAPALENSTGDPAKPRAPLQSRGETREVVMPDTAALGCVQCHMPLVERPLVEGGEVRRARRHLWRGGHDPEMVKKGLEVTIGEETPERPGERRTFVLTLTNVGAAHYLPTGTPDRHLTARLRLLDRDGMVIREREHTLKRTVMWRPFIVDLRDTRLPRWQPRRYEFSFRETGRRKPATLEVVVRYHLLAESRRRRIGYRNTDPISYEVFRKAIPLTDNTGNSGFGAQYTASSPRPDPRIRLEPRNLNWGQGYER